MRDQGGEGEVGENNKDPTSEGIVVAAGNLAFTVSITRSQVSFYQCVTFKNHPGCQVGGKRGGLENSKALGSPRRLKRTPPKKSPSGLSTEANGLLGRVVGSQQGPSEAPAGLPELGAWSPGQGDPSPSGSPLSVADGQSHPGLSEALPRATSATHRISSW